ncbi:hypothetical protein [Listeria innocua]|uniref:hypothetical protein n=1 Tax=Listeria innocua TaxID=1642 RepID=UPI001623D966|nr:hypothetical protein [Listeria innocua]EBF5204970.1 hypothetical protein [Listeria monocytogenes]MBC1339571.1 hypothetical protein [Listeria innocua]
MERRIIDREAFNKWNLFFRTSDGSIGLIGEEDNKLSLGKIIVISLIIVGFVAGFIASFFF